MGDTIISSITETATVADLSEGDVKFREQAQQLESEGRIEAAIETIREGLSRFPESVGLHTRLADLMLRLGSLPEAEAALRAALDLQDDPATRDRLSRVLEQQGQLQKAVGETLSAAESSPDPDRFSRAGMLLLRLERFDEAEAAFREAITLRPRVFGYHHLLSIALDHQGKLEEAIAEAREVISIDASAADRYSRLGHLLLRAGRLEDAEVACRQATAMSPMTAPFHHVLSLVLERQGRLDEAIAEAELVIEGGSEEPHGYARKAALLIEAERYEEAEAVLRRSLEVCPRDLGLNDTLSFVLARLKRPDEAAEALHRPIQVEPANMRRRLRQAQLLLRARKPEEAEAALHEAISRAPDADFLHDAMSYALHDQGRIDESIEEMRRTILLGGDSLARQLWLGHLFLRAERRIDAEQAFRRALEIDPHSGQARERLSALDSQTEPAAVKFNGPSNDQPEDSEPSTSPVSAPSEIGVAGPDLAKDGDRNGPVTSVGRLLRRTYRRTQRLRASQPSSRD
ncbi:MAG TPA: tetratricopeptide repeat protein [Acetobacteraceae bacterium]|nr:tetratricopeptide repeat protein [Acetobacteraceae bacterium]